jgi:hypothetical protein
VQKQMEDAMWAQSVAAIQKGELHRYEETP